MTTKEFSENKSTIFIDELWANRFILTIYLLFIHTYPILLLMMYPGIENFEMFFLIYEEMPFYSLIARDQDIFSKPYLGYAVIELYSYLWFYFLPYVAYRFYTIDTRDNGKTEEFLRKRPMTYNQIYIQRFAAILVEFGVVLLVFILGIVVSELNIGETDDTLMEVLVILLAAPVMFFIGAMCSFLLKSTNKYGKLIGFLYISLFFCMAYVVGLITPNLEFIAFLSPLYYYNPVKILYQGIDFVDIFIQVVFIVGTVMFILLRLRLKDQYKESKNFDSLAN